MGGDTRFWYLFGGIWLIVGAGMLLVSLGIEGFADPAALNEDGPPPWIFGLIGFVVGGAGIAIIWRARDAAAQDKQLMETGLALTATVIDVVASPITINRQTRWNVVYRYEYHARKFEGKSRALDGPMVSEFKPGQSVRIRIDPEKPEKSLFLGIA